MDLTFIFMIVIGAMLILTAIMLAIIAFAKKREEINIFSIVCGAFGLFLVILNSTSYAYQSSSYNEKMYDIYSLKPTDNVIHGGFALGIGSINSKTHYYFYIETEDGFKKLEHVSAENTLIKETNDIEPSVYKVKEPWENGMVIMYVPENTIQIEWQL